MNKRRILFLVVIFAVAAMIGSQKKLNEEVLRAAPESAPTTRSVFVQNDQAVEEVLEVEKELTGLESLDQSIARISKGMPTKQELRALGEHELHHMPLSIAELSEELGNIKQLLHDNPTDGLIIGKSIAFYRTCSVQGEWPSSVRALCLANLHEVAGESFDSAPVELYRLAKLAVELPET
ncbi:MAG: hypothetical protein CME71_00085 [Halobacteriovorax sp.]|nr:hypothetical protein [Halobacteriovorax sp.]